MEESNYGLIYKTETDFVNVANKAGHHSMALGEYSFLEKNKNNAKKQLEWFYNNGVRMIHCLEALGDQRKYEFDVMKGFVKSIENPRPGYAGVTDAGYAINDGKKKYDIIQLGAGTDHEELLKSIDCDGSFEGTVYLVPFHSHINVEAIDGLTLSGGKATTGVIKELCHGDQVELTWAA